MPILHTSSISKPLEYIGKLLLTISWLTGILNFNKSFCINLFSNIQEVLKFIS
ncbi:hypothetical protein HMPREF9094_2494, partial [Fusobacterium animalis ATCC 51191]